MGWGADFEEMASTPTDAGVAAGPLGDPPVGCRNFGFVLLSLFLFLPGARGLRLATKVHTRVFEGIPSSKILVGAMPVSCRGRSIFRNSRIAVCQAQGRLFVHNAGLVDHDDRKYS